MPRYTVNHRYHSFRDGVQYGTYEAGSEVELSEAEAEWIGIDSPGVLSEAAAEPQREGKPSANRQHKGGQNRAAR